MDEDEKKLGMPRLSPDTRQHFTHPNEITPLWRYMNFAKFISLLETRAIFMSRADRLGEDTFEGSIPSLNAMFRQRDFGDNPQLLGSWKAMTEDAVRRTFVSCWHMNENESAAMWRLYALEAIAIKSVFWRLLKQIPLGYYVGEVTYLNYERELIAEERHIAVPFFHKRRSFEHERELRVVRYVMPPLKDPITEQGGYDFESPALGGLSLPVDIVQLIEAVYVSPHAAAWMRDTVEAVCNRYQLGRPVVQSSLFNGAVY